jgi:hypothetical protein
MCWGDRKQVDELRKEVNRLRAELYQLIEYCDDEDRMGNFVEAIRFRCRKALDSAPADVR